MCPSDWSFLNNTRPKILFTRNVNNFVTRAFFFFCFFDVRRLKVLKTTLKNSKVDFYFIKGKIFSKIFIEARFFIHFLFVAAEAYFRLRAFLIPLLNSKIVIEHFVASD